MKRFAWRPLVAVLLLMGVSACDSTPVLFPNAESVEFLAGDGAGPGTGTGTLEFRGEVGLPLAPAPTLRLVDGAGNPAPGVTVELNVTGGDGSLGRAIRVSDRDGVVRLDDWTLGQQAGANRLEVRLRNRGAGSAGSGAPAFALDAVGEPGPPAEVELLPADGAAPPSLEGQVGEELTPLLRFRVRDRFGNPVPGAGLLADLLGSGGSLPATSATTDASGEAGLGRWTLGPTAGIQRLRIAATGTAGVALELEATALPGPAATLRVEGDLPDEGTVGARLPGERVVAALDAFENPVPGVVVAVAPDGAPAAAGTVSAPQTLTGENGRATLPDWTLGTQAGPQRLRLRVAETPSAPDTAQLLYGILAVAGPPAGMEASSPTSLSGVRGSPLDPRPAVRVEDAFGNPVAGVPVTFAPADGAPGPTGELSGTTPTTNAAGEARLGAWFLPETLGTVQVEATVPAGAAGLDAPLGPVLFSAQVMAPGRTLELRSGGGQEGETGSPPPNPIVVRLTGDGGTGVANEEVELQVVAGGGSVTPSSMMTNAVGELSITGWSLGPELGENRLRLSAEGAQSLVVVALATSEPPPPPEVWTLEAVHLNQGNQTFQGTIPLVADRGGLLRVFLRGSVTSGPGVQVRMRIRLGGVVVLDQTVTRGGASTVLAAPSDPDDMEASWNVSVPGALVQPGAELQVEVDPGGVLGLAPGESLTWPSEGGWGPLDVVSLPTFRATFLPVESTYFGLTGRITPGNQGDYLDETVDSFPVSAFDFQVRTTPFVYDGSFVNASAGWNGLLQDIRDLRLVEAAFDRYYHGILQRPSGAGIAGLAYIASSPEGISNLAAVSFDQLPVAAEVIAHEFGHNFGRRHAPCANPAGIDPAFPHANGGLGNPGYSLALGLLRPTTEFRDTMGYCFPMWTSDYTWAGILAMRALRPVGGPPVAASAGTPTSFASAVGLMPTATPHAGLLVGGHWSSAEAPALRTPIPLEVPATPQDPSGEVQVELLDAEGRVLARGRYPAAEVDHADDPSLRHFGAVVRLPAGTAGAASVRVTTPAGSALWEAPGGASQAMGAQPAPSGTGATGTAPTVTATRVQGGGAAGTGSFRSSADAQGGIAAVDGWRLEWDAQRWPVLVLSDPASGQIRGFLRSGDALIRSGGAVPRLEFLLTDGAAAYRVSPELR